MRVAIDATPLLLRSAGVKTYTYHWIQHLRLLAGEESVRAFPFLGKLSGYSHEVSVAGRLGTLGRLAFLHAANYSRLPMLDWIERRVDVFHACHVLRNPPRRTHVTATIYDMTCWLAPETHSARNVQAVKRFAETDRKSVV